MSRSDRDLLSKHSREFLLLLGLLILVPLLPLTNGQAQAQSDCQDCIRINEFQFEPSNGPNGDPSNTGEFIELFNRCDTAVDIGCMQLCALTASVCGECVQIPDGTVLPAGDVFTMGGYGTNCSGGGVTTCDFPGLSLDLNWHDCGCVNDPDEGVSCSNNNTGNYWGVLVDGGEDIMLFGSDNSLTHALTYKGGGGYSSGDCGMGGTLSNSGCNGCSNSSLQLPNSSSLTNIGSGSGITGFVSDCNGAFMALSNSSQFGPGSSECSNLIDPPCCKAEAAFTVNDSTQCAPSNSFDMSNAGSSGSSYSHSWSFGDGASANVEDPVHSYADTGYYKVRLVVDSANACADTAERTMLVGFSDASLLPVGDTITCGDQSLMLDASNSSAWPAPLSFSWSSPNGTIASGGNSSIATVEQGGDFQVLVSSGPSGCKDSAMVTVPVDTTSPDLNIEAPDALGCGVDSLWIEGSASTSDPGTPVIDWSTGNGNILSDDDTSSIRVDQGGSYALTVTDTSNGCVRTKVEDVQVDNSGPNASFAPQPAQGSVPLEVNFVNKSTGAKAYEWQFGDGAKASSSDPSHIYQEEGSYEAKLIARGKGSCADTAYYSSIVVDMNIELEVPNVFSPNGDGRNESFRVKGKGIERLKGRVYNRWGQKIYAWQGVSEGWDGRTSAGNKVPEGTYFFDIRAYAQDGTLYQREGSVTLVR